MSGSSIRGVLQTYWALAIANLAAHLEGRPLLPRTDFTSTDLRGELTIAAPADRVWRSLTDSEQASAWFGYPIGIEPWVGGRYAMGGFESGYAAKVIDLEPGRKMSVDWGPVGVSTWELAESGGKTKLTFVQSGFDEGNPPYAAWSGSVAGLAELRRLPRDGGLAADLARRGDADCRRAELSTDQQVRAPSPARRPSPGGAPDQPEGEVGAPPAQRWASPPQRPAEWGCWDCGASRRRRRRRPRRGSPPSSRPPPAAVRRSSRGRRPPAPRARSVASTRPG